MVLVIDTSSTRSALALVEAGEPLAEDVREGGRERDLPGRVTALVGSSCPAAVCVSLGPGSFTGLRVGVSFGVGFALALGVPLLGLGSLELQAARARGPATAVVEAGRGRVYWAAPGGAPRHGDPEDLPRQHPVVGWLRPPTAERLRRMGLRLLCEPEADGFAMAAARLLGRARELGYDTVELEYMQSVGRVRV
ncbi:MAG TPA: tRNA (adenosine(37)-N6)-threonylcarbamoyltransferase complex dimerization subunit type 1 TsaB [Candidatus Dormibacteraeota bacterium]|nr:tRNA (adenosine(37)-N6)-threonylcarbamoyltransferase complex dimerization subunit type 1 TsaB [Candidatus Dormibacteraeota bacterium]